MQAILRVPNVYLLVYAQNELYKHSYTCLRWRLEFYVAVISLIFLIASL
jgi:hypothetical protein